MTAGPGGMHSTQQEWHRVLSDKFEEEEFVNRKTAEAAWARKCQKRAEQRSATKVRIVCYMSSRM